MTAAPEPVQRSWREIVEKADGPGRHEESLYPKVYTFSNGRTFKDSGPNSGVYDT
jgi:hypothetical protein